MNQSCCFFGHKDTPVAVKTDLHDAIEDLISKGVTTFYVGNQGAFDAYVRTALQAACQRHSHIRYAVVLAYMPGECREYEDYGDTMLPEGIEDVHPRYAIDWRNRWMLRQSRYVVCYIRYTWGGAARYVQTARRQGKSVINLCTDAG